MNSFVYNMEELLSICSRSIVAPDRITMEANKMMTIINDRNLEQKFIVEGCETLSLLASSFLRSGYDSFIVNYAYETGINHWVSGFKRRDELIKYCEFCVKHGDECLDNIRNTLAIQLEIENKMTTDEIYDLNVKKLEFKREMLNFITVQDHITNYIKLSLIVNSLKEFFKEYYKGLN